MKIDNPAHRWPVQVGKFAFSALDFIKLEGTKMVRRG